MTSSISPAPPAPDGSAVPATVVDRLLGLLAGHARRSPEAPAVITRDRTASWSEVGSETALLAAAMHRRGIGPGTSVALLTGRSSYALTALLATWSCGATAVLLDERHPVERTVHALRDSGTRYVLAAEITPAMLGLGAAILPVASLLAGAGQHDLPDRAGIPIAAAQADALAYLIYTSGTTGLPKGVEISFGNLDAFVAALQTLGLPEGGVGVNAVSPAFDGWLWCALLYLVYGQALGIVDLIDSDEAGIGAALDALRPTVVCLTPSLLAACDSELDSARVVVAAGEVCTPELVSRFGTGRRMLNVYGPTESTIAATWADSARGHDLTTIGVPLPGYSAHVLDPQGQPVASDAAG
ncbi:MAG TPA: AMP-binding protein, partial [Jatrophihabitans sp.]